MILWSQSSLDEKEKLRAAFRRLQARTRAERAAILRDRAKWSEKRYWSELARRLVFD